MTAELVRPRPDPADPACFGDVEEDVVADLRPERALDEGAMNHDTEALVLLQHRHGRQAVLLGIGDRMLPQGADQLCGSGSRYREVEGARYTSRRLTGS